MDETSLLFFSLVINKLTTQVLNLFFSEHGKCGAANRKSQRCVEGYEVSWFNGEA